MTDFGFYERQMAQYAAYHQDRRNRATHLVGVPVIIFSLLLVASLWRWQLAGVEVTAAHALALAALVLWFTLDVVVGLVLAVVLTPVFLLADWLAAAWPGSAAWWLFGATFVGGWVLQLLGHAFEGRRPALVDNLFQILIAPMFLAAELLFALGLRRELAARIEACRRLRSDAGRPAGA